MNHTFFTRSCFLTACSGHFTGEFGSVREALLKLDDGSFQKVAVKMLKGKWEQSYLKYLREESLERLNAICPTPQCSLLLSELPTQPLYPCCLLSLSCQSCSRGFAEKDLYHLSCLYGTLHVVSATKTKS